MHLKRLLRTAPWGLALVLGCGDDSGREDSDSGSSGNSNISASSGLSGLTTAGSDDSTGSSDGGTAGSDGGTDSSGSAGTSGDPTGGLKFDLGVTPDAAEEGCGGDGVAEFSFIWISNSAQGTVSKIDTKTGVEMGRYWTDPSQGLGSPSRTSVNLLGDVAVSNRNQPSTTKIAALVDNCVDKNNNGVIETSTGPGDVLPWGADECVLWHMPFPDSPGGSLGPRPTQWAGEQDANGCPLANPRLWVAYEDGADTAHFLRLDGATGAKLDEVTYPWPLSTGYGPYGGAVNAEGDLWAIGLYTDAPLVHIDSVTLQLTYHGNPGGVGFYGIAVDADGNPWIGGHNGVVFFDAQTQQFTVIPTGGTTRGITVDREGRAWAAADSGCGLVELDVATRTVVNQLVPLPGCSSPWGVAVDVDGYIWSPDMSSNVAFKLDPDTHQVVLTVQGLIGPYTYSDMTGAGLGLVINPPG
ncbi:MAG: hypothetical protein R3A51_09850 [Nannocystaceae bacterium]|nr:hypothetical protein [Myxococcales bacterium]